jgi:hypothetical protein
MVPSSVAPAKLYTGSLGKRGNGVKRMREGIFMFRNFFSVVAKILSLMEL